MQGNSLTRVLGKVHVWIVLGTWEPYEPDGKGGGHLGREGEPKMHSRSVVLFTFVFQYGFAVFCLICGLIYKNTL